MQRREILKLIGGASIAAATLPATIFAGSFNGRFILIGRKNSPEWRHFLQAIDPFIAHRFPSWIADATVLDSEGDLAEIREFYRRYAPNTILRDEPVLLRVPSHSGGEIESWTPEWLSHQFNLISDACYKVSGGWWSVEGDFNPTINKVRDHLFQSPNHETGKFEWDYLSKLRFAELQSLHSDHHREMTDEGSVHWDLVNRECPTLL